MINDGVLRQEVSQGVSETAFLNDLVILVQAGNEETLKFRTNETLRKIDVWIMRHNLNLAPEKTEYFILKGLRRKCHIAI